MVERGVLGTLRYRSRDFDGRPFSGSDPESSAPSIPSGFGSTLVPPLGQSHGCAENPPPLLLRSCDRVNALLQTSIVHSRIDFLAGVGYAPRPCIASARGRFSAS